MHQSKESASTEKKKRDEKTKGKREHRLEEVTRLGMLWDTYPAWLQSR